MLERIRQLFDRADITPSEDAESPDWLTEGNVGIIVGQIENPGEDVTFFEVYVGPGKVRRIHKSLFRVWGAAQDRPAQLGTLVEVGRVVGGKTEDGSRSPGLNPMPEKRFSEVPDEQIRYLFKKLLELKPNHHLEWLEWIEPRHIPELTPSDVQQMLASEHDKLRSIGVRLSGHVEPGR